MCVNHYRSTLTCLKQEQQDIEGVFNYTELDKIYIVSHGDIYMSVRL